MKIVTIDALDDKAFWSLRRSPIVLFALFCSFFRCKLKSNVVSNTIPRCLWFNYDLSKFWLRLCFDYDLFSLSHRSDCLLLKSYFEQRRTERCHPQIILGLKSSHQISNSYRSERTMFPASTYDECCPFKITFCFPCHKKSIITFKSLPDTPFCFNL